MFAHCRCPFALFFKFSSPSRLWPCRDLIRLWRVLLPLELLILSLLPHAFHGFWTPLAAWASIWMLACILRRHWGQHRGHGAATLMLLMLPFSAFNLLPSLPWGTVSALLASVMLADRVMGLRKLILPLLLLGWLPTTIYADTAQAWSGKAEITFDGTSTLHDWGGKVSAKPFATSVILDDNGKPKRVQATVTVEAAKMDTVEAKRDENMRKAMKASDHPLISARINVPADKIASDLKTPTQLPMTLTLLGKPQQITGTITNFKQQAGKVTFDLEFPVSMKASGISVPTVLLFIKVGDGIKVRASVTLTKN